MDPVGDGVVLIGDGADPAGEVPHGEEATDLPSLHLEPTHLTVRQHRPVQLAHIVPLQGPAAVIPRTAHADLSTTATERDPRRPEHPLRRRAPDTVSQLRARAAQSTAMRPLRQPVAEEAIHPLPPILRQTTATALIAPRQTTLIQATAITTATAITPVHVDDPDPLPAATVVAEAAVSQAEAQPAVTAEAVAAVHAVADVEPTVILTCFNLRY